MSRGQELENFLIDLLHDGMNEFTPLPHWAVKKIREVLQ